MAEDMATINPSCQKLRFSFRHAFVSGILQPAGTNCEIDPDDFFGDICSFLRSKGTSARPNSAQTHRSMAVDHSWAMDLAVANGFKYISGYFARRMLTRYKCDNLEKILTTGEISKNCNTNSFIALKAFKNTEGHGLIVPSDGYHQTITDLETVFSDNIDSLFYRPKVCFNLESMSKSSVHDTPFHEHDRCCGCSDTWSHFIKLFMTVRIKWEVRERNRNRRSNKRNQACPKQNAKMRKLSQ